MFNSEKQYKLLGEEIVRQACHDYIDARKRIRLGIFNKENSEMVCKKRIKEITKFFYGKMYSLITDISPDYMIRMCERCADDASADDIRPLHTRRT